MSLLRELRLFAIGYGVSLSSIVLIGSLGNDRSSLPWWKRVLTLEDAGCAYGACFFFALAGYGVIRGCVLLVDMRRRWNAPLTRR